MDRPEIENHEHSSDAELPSTVVAPNSAVTHPCSHTYARLWSSLEDFPRAFEGSFGVYEKDSPLLTWASFPKHISLVTWRLTRREKLQQGQDTVGHQPLPCTHTRKHTCKFNKTRGFHESLCEGSVRGFKSGEGVYDE